MEGENIEGALSVTEIHIYAIYLQLLWKINPKEKEQIIDRVFQLMQYVNRHYVEEQQRVKIYPLLVCLWGNLIIEEKIQIVRLIYLMKHFSYCRNKNHCIVY